MILLAVDPSLRSTGVALFRDGELIAVSKIRTACGPSDDIAHRARAMARDVAAWEARIPERQGGRPDALAVEWPQVYRTAKSKGDPNDLLGLAGVCAAVAALYPSALVTSYCPAAWEPAPKVSSARKLKKLGPVDSEAFTSPRGVRIMGRLSKTERVLVPESHDAVDAVGIGLHHLGRLAVARVFHGATPG